MRMFYKVPREGTSWDHPPVSVEIYHVRPRRTLAERHSLLANVLWPFEEHSKTRLLLWNPSAGFVNSRLVQEGHLNLRGMIIRAASGSCKRGI